MALFGGCGDVRTLVTNDELEIEGGTLRLIP
jgi:hypothetical protein